MALKENEQHHGEEILDEMEAPRSAGRSREVSRKRFDKAIMIAIREFVKKLDEDDIYRLCQGGSIWIDKDDARLGHVDADSFEVLGSTSDSRVTTYGEEIGAHCLIDCDGLADGFVFEDDIDADGDEIEAESEDLLYSEEKGRKTLLDCVKRSIKGDLDNLWFSGLEN
jgi:hypothetical protein